MSIKKGKGPSKTNPEGSSAFPEKKASCQRFFMPNVKNGIHSTQGETAAQELQAAVIVQFKLHYIHKQVKGGEGYLLQNDSRHSVRPGLVLI